MKPLVAILLGYATMLPIVSFFSEDERETIVYCIELVSLVISCICVYIMCYKEEGHL